MFSCEIVNANFQSCYGSDLLKNAHIHDDTLFAMVEGAHLTFKMLSYTTCGVFATVFIILDDLIVIGCWPIIIFVCCYLFSLDIYGVESNNGTAPHVT